MKTTQIIEMNNTEYQRVFYAIRTLNPNKTPKQLRRIALRKMREK